MSTAPKSNRTTIDPLPCAVTVRSGWHDTGCRRAASVERDGVWYCGTHDPVKVTAREQKRQAKTQHQMDVSDAILREGKRLCHALGVDGRVEYGRDMEIGGWRYQRRVVLTFDDLKNLIAKAESR